MNNTTTTRLELDSILLLSSTEGAVAASHIIRCVKRTPAYPAAARHVHSEEPWKSWFLICACWKIRTLQKQSGG